MRYCYIDFFPWDKKIVISQLEKEGKHVYSVADAGGTRFNVGKELIVNRYGYVVTDEPLPLGDRRAMTDKEFYDMNPVEDDSLKKTSVDLSGKIKKAKAEYDAARNDRESEWKRIQELQEISMQLESKYDLFKACPNQKRPHYNEGRILILQYISVLGVSSDEMNVGYFIRSEETGKMLTNSSTVTVPRECEMEQWLKAIEEREGLTGRKLIKDNDF